MEFFPAPPFSNQMKTHSHSCTCTIHKDNINHKNNIAHQWQRTQPRCHCMQCWTVAKMTFLYNSRQMFFLTLNGLWEFPRCSLSAPILFHSFFLFHSFPFHKKRSSLPSFLLEQCKLVGLALLGQKCGGEGTRTLEFHLKIEPQNSPGDLRNGRKCQLFTLQLEPNIHWLFLRESSSQITFSPALQLSTDFSFHVRQIKIGLPIGSGTDSNQHWAQWEMKVWMFP